MLKLTLSEKLAKNWFWIALAVVIVFGYQLGKDRALSLNEADRSELRSGR